MVTSHHGSPVKRYQHGNQQLRNGFWHVSAVSLAPPAKPGTVHPNTLSCLPFPVGTAAVCGQSDGELVVFCVFPATTPIASSQSTKTGSKSVSLRKGRTSNFQHQIRQIRVLKQPLNYTNVFHTDLFKHGEMHFLCVKQYPRDANVCC